MKQILLIVALLFFFFHSFGEIKEIRNSSGADAFRISTCERRAKAQSGTGPTRSFCLLAKKRAWGGPTFCPERAR